ncbi:hypothetical protein GGS20DRAFT_596436 [Poronia punctata]|nr:hypothetical protein GGS20DRAFT_596436 [Poronia punctata]
MKAARDRKSSVLASNAVHHRTGCPGTRSTAGHVDEDTHDISWVTHRGVASRKLALINHLCQPMDTLSIGWLYDDGASHANNQRRHVSALGPTAASPLPTECIAALIEQNKPPQQLGGIKETQRLAGRDDQPLNTRFHPSPFSPPPNPPPKFLCVAAHILTVVMACRIISMLRQGQRPRLQSRDLCLAKQRIIEGRDSLQRSPGHDVWWQQYSGQTNRVDADAGHLPATFPRWYWRSYVPGTEASQPRRPAIETTCLVSLAWSEAGLCAWKRAILSEDKGATRPRLTMPIGQVRLFRGLITG